MSRATEEMARLLAELDASPLPDRLPRQVTQAVDLAALHDEGLACVRAFMLLGELSPREQGLLRACRAELGRVLPALRFEAGEYFGQLHRLMTLVLRRVDEARPMGL